MYTFVLHTHCSIRQFVHRSMWVDAVNVGTRAVDATQHESGADMALVAEQHALQQG